MKVKKKNIYANLTKFDITYVLSPIHKLFIRRTVNIPFIQSSFQTLRCRFPEVHSRRDLTGKPKKGLFTFLMKNG